MEVIIYVVVAVLGILIGGVVTSTILRKQVLSKSNTVLEEAKEKGEVIKKEKILQAKEKFLQLKSEHEKLIGKHQRTTVGLKGKVKGISTGKSHVFEDS